MPRKLGFVVAVSAILVSATYLVLRSGGGYGLWVLAMTALPTVAAILADLDLKRLVPDFLFGAIDTGLLTVGALIGAAGFGVAGAIVGGVVGDAVTDAIAGFFEGSIAEWLRRHGIDERRTAIGSAFGKMAGCLFGSGAVLTLARTAGVAITPP